jgi:hypothetical protein
MKHFKKLAEGVDTTAILAEIDAWPEAWLKDTSRQNKVKCQRETQTIFLRSGVKPWPEGVTTGNDVHPSRMTRMAASFPKTLEWVENLAAEQGARMARVTLVKLQPKGRVYPHIDHDEYYRIRDRYHLVLRSKDGSPLTTEGETAVMREGELWVFDNKRDHWAENTSDEPRIHMIFDLEPAEGRGHYIYPLLKPELPQSV